MAVSKVDQVMAPPGPGKASDGKEAPVLCISCGPTWRNPNGWECAFGEDGPRCVGNIGWVMTARAGDARRHERHVGPVPCLCVAC
jgi:hypothetical protein